AFITNRVGDAGFIIGLLIIWTYVGTFNFEEIFQRVRSPLYDSHNKAIANGAQIVRADRDAKDPDQYAVTKPDKGDYAVLFPLDVGDHFHGLSEGEPFEVAGGGHEGHQGQTEHEGHAHGGGFAVIPYWLLVAAGLGIFLGCVGKSAQFPLQVW